MPLGPRFRADERRRCGDSISLENARWETQRESRIRQIFRVWSRLPRRARLRRQRQDAAAVAARGTNWLGVTKDVVERAKTFAGSRNVAFVADMLDAERHREPDGIP